MPSSNETHGRQTRDTPTLEEEAALLGEEIKLLPVTGFFPRICQVKHPLLVPCPSSLFLNQTFALLQRPRNLGRDLMLIQIILVDEFTLTSRKIIEYLNGGENSNCIHSPPQMNTSEMSQSK